MPTSYIENVPLIMALMERNMPKSVLDVGPGYGKYGFLFRERVDDFTWQRTIDCIDPFDDYLRRSMSRRLYDTIYKGEFPYRTHVWSPGAGFWRPLHYPGTWPGIRYDMILMIDVLEHYTEEGGEAAIKAALELAPKTIISTPIGFVQGESHGNIHEEHRSEWPAEKIDEVASQFSGRFYDFSRGFHTSSPRATSDSVIGVLQKVNL